MTLPGAVRRFFLASILGAPRKNPFEAHCHQIRITPKQAAQTDDYPYGGGCMVRM
ncbi:MAG: hypothetical protein ACLVHY_06955 [Gemmiger sp.]